MSRIKVDSNYNPIEPEYTERPKKNGKPDWFEERYGLDARKLHEKAWDKSSMLIGVAFIAAIVWFASMFLKLLFPAKWGFIQGLIGVISFIGKWAFLASIAVFFILIAAGITLKIIDKVKEYRW